MRGLWIALPSMIMASSALGQVATPSQDIAATSPGSDSETEQADSHSDIQYDRSDRMTLSVTVNGRSDAKFLVDTGSERTIVSDELATELDLPRGRSVKISGTVGSAIAPTAHIESLNFTNISIDNLTAPVLKQADMGAEGLIGIDSLQKKLIIFDFENDRMEIKANKRRAVRSVVTDEEIVVTARSRLGRLVITDAYVDNVPITVVIDSGAQYSIGNLALLKKLEKKRKFNSLLGSLHGVTGHRMVVPVGVAKHLEIGKLGLKSVPIAFTDSPAFHTLELDQKPALLLGMNTLRAFRRVEVDFTNRSVRFFSPDGAGLHPQQRYASRETGLAPLQ